jgi:hypothetical protein
VIYVIILSRLHRRIPAKHRKPSKLTLAVTDWQANAATQIRWGLGYIKSVYGSPCAAWGHEQVHGWY